MFRERRRIHVINPKLAASRATEDTHAQGEAMAKNLAGDNIQLHFSFSLCRLTKNLRADMEEKWRFVGDSDATKI